mmetsp:Transcript_71336/g.134817  ORF Transcript_71336/g.134817 Transcript_71336/m.134817 type:complete len:196 (+) Transcript_71336:111-698(+)
MVMRFTGLLARKADMFLAFTVLCLVCHCFADRPDLREPEATATAGGAGGAATTGGAGSGGGTAYPPIETWKFDQLDSLNQAYTNLTAKIKETHAALYEDKEGQEVNRVKVMAEDWLKHVKNLKEQISHMTILAQEAFRAMEAENTEFSKRVKKKDEYRQALDSLSGGGSGSGDGGSEPEIPAAGMDGSDGDNSGG